MLVLDEFYVVFGTVDLTYYTPDDSFTCNLELARKYTDYSDATEAIDMLGDEYEHLMVLKVDAKYIIKMAFD